jgi:Protein of unknown function (DUF3253)
VIQRARIEAEILALLARRDASSSICPSEVARALADDWRPLMHAVREAAAALADSGRVRITRGGADVPRHEIHHGAIRLVRGPHFDAASVNSCLKPPGELP